MIEEIELNRKKLNDEITKWYIFGCRFAQLPNIDDKNKAFLASCIDTLKIMVEN